MTFRPIADWIVFVRDETPLMHGLLHLPSPEKQSEQKRGRAVAVGPGRWDKKRFIATTIKPGDYVLFDPFADLRPIDADKNLWAGAEYHACGVIE